jgi:tripartite-type tricarboxylate transporter receptor subunit TctC
MQMPGPIPESSAPRPQTKDRKRGNQIMKRRPGMKAFWQFIAIAFAWLGLANVAAAQSFPSKIVKITAPYSSGAAPAVFMHVVAESLSKMWGQQVIIDAKPGASGFIAIGEVKNAAPDGYSLLAMANSHVAINPALYGAKLPYDPVKDFAPAAMFFYTHFFITVSTSGPYQTVPALIAAAKANPGKLSYGSSYVGSPSHLGAAELEYLTGTKMIHVPFKDQSQMYVQIANGDLAWAFSTLGSALPLIRGGRIKLLAIGDTRRLATLPDVPTIGEAGGPGGLVVDSWIGLFAPRGTPPEIVRTINAGVNRALGTQEVLDRLKTFGFEGAPVTPEQFADVIRTDQKRYAEIVQRTGATAN